MGLQLHLFLPQMRMSPSAIVERALAAEAAGFEGIAFMDHLAPPLAAEHDMWEAMELAAWVLARTETLVVGHLVLCDAFRHPAVLARQVTTLDHASGGRFELGLGWGSVPEELETFGVGSTGARTRVERMAETLALLQALWAGEVVDFAGDHFALQGAQQRPTPTRRIPITIGGSGPRTMALVREHADWWNIPVHQLSALDDRRAEAGGAKVSMQLMVGLVPSEADREQVLATAQRRYGYHTLGESLLVGTAEELTAHFASLRDRGVERIYPWFTDFAPPETLQRFGEVIAELR